MTTSTRTRRVRRGVGGHEVSKPRVIVASWSAERIGPRIIAAPQRGHAHVSTVGVVGRRRRRRDGRARRAEERAREGDARGPTGVREKPRLPNADEAARQDVLDEAAQKLHRGQRHRAPLIVVGVVLPLKGDVVTVEGEQPMIADRHAMGVAPEVAQHGGRSAEGRLRVDDPVRLEERIDEGVPLRRVAQVLGGAGEIEFVPGVRAPERVDKLPAKDPTEDLHGQEEAGVLRLDPALVIGREAAGRHDAVHVRMADQGLSPGVEDAQHADLGAEMSRIGGDLAERRRARLKEPRVQARTIPIGQRQERMRQREDDVHIRHVEQLPLARLEPALAGLRLALRAVPIPTRVVGDGLMPAGVTPIEMAAERGGPTARDRAKDRSLLHAQPRMLLEEGVTLRVEDIGHLHRRPAHAGLGFRFSRDRGRTTGVGTCSCSSGFGAACRCRCERWR